MTKVDAIDRTAQLDLERRRAMRELRRKRLRPDVHANTDDHGVDSWRG